MFLWIYLVHINLETYITTTLKHIKFYYYYFWSFFFKCILLILVWLSPPVRYISMAMYEAAKNKCGSPCFPLSRRCLQQWSRCSQLIGTPAGTRDAAAWPVWSKTTLNDPTSSGSWTSRSVDTHQEAVLHMAITSLWLTSVVASRRWRSPQFISSGGVPQFDIHEDFIFL